MAFAATRFAGYAYYSSNGDGFVYALRADVDDISPGTPVVVVNGVSKASNFFQFLFLLVGGILTLLLLVIVSITFCCRRGVAALEERYWRLQHAYAEVNGALVHEVAQRTPDYPPASTKRQPSMQRLNSSNSMRSQQQQQQQMQRRSSTNSMRSQHQYQQPPQQMQRYASTHSVRTQQQQQQEMMQQPVQMVSTPSMHQRISNPWTLTSEAVGVYPPRQPPTQPLFPSAPMPTTNTAAYDYNMMYNTNPVVAAPILPSTPQMQQQQQQQSMVAPHPIISPAAPHADAPSTSPSASPEGLRRRESKVRFINTT
jgi:hypothetical protein